MAVAERSKIVAHEAIQRASTAENGHRPGLSVRFRYVVWNLLTSGQFAVNHRPIRGDIMRHHSIDIDATAMRLARR
jgi:hypothetical protein